MCQKWCQIKKYFEPKYTSMYQLATDVEVFDLRSLWFGCLIGPNWTRFAINSRNLRVSLNRHVRQVVWNTHIFVSFGVNPVQCRVNVAPLQLIANGWAVIRPYHVTRAALSDLSRYRGIHVWLMDVLLEKWANFTKLSKAYQKKTY